MTDTLPTEKTITYPIWRDQREHLFSVDDIVGALAMWAIRQSPYPVPTKLEEACLALHRVLEAEWSKREPELGFIRLCGNEIESLLLECFKRCPDIEAWNEPRSRHTEKFVTRSRFHQPAPDDDFIDLDALARNVSHTLVAQRLIEEDQSS